MPIQQMFLGAGGASVVEYTASNATNISLSSVFGSDWAADVEKSYVIPVGVELGATSTSNDALTAESGMGGTLTITVAGTVSGAGGAGGDGGRGEGYNHGSQSGSSGGSSTEAQYGYNTFRGNVSGGSGGNGGSYGNSGSNGSNGGDGYTVPGDFPSGFDSDAGPGTGGSGGLAGYSLKKGSGITVSQSGGGTQVGRT